MLRRSDFVESRFLVPSVQRIGDPSSAIHIWGFPKIRGPFFGSPYNKSPTILGSILGPLIFGISHFSHHMQCMIGQPSRWGA